MGEKTEDGDREEPKRDRMFTGSHPYLESLGNREFPAKSWSKGDKDGDREEPKRDRMFTGSRPALESSRGMEFPAKSWSKDED